MSHDRDAGGDQGVDDVGLIGPAFQFDGLAASFLEDASGSDDGLVNALMVDGEWQIDHDQSVLGSSSDHLCMINHFVERYRQRVFVTLHDHGHAVANQQHFHAGLVQQPSHGVVVGGQHRDPRSLRFHFLNRRDSHSLVARFLFRFGGRVTHGWVGCGRVVSERDDGIVAAKSIGQKYPTDRMLWGSV